MINKISFLYVVIGFTLLSCKPETKSSENREAKNPTALVGSRYAHLLKYPLDSTAFPRSLDHENKIRKTSSGDWTSGFFAGNLWKLYQLTGKEAYKNRAIAWTAFSEPEKENADSHDVGFKVFCSVGMGLEVTGDPLYKQTILDAAKTLCSRFNPTVGSIRSWDFNKEAWEFPVIIDNMMNLELLFEATKISGDSTFYKIAEHHANTTLTHHFRENNSSYHVVSYDTVSGDVQQKVTHQGFSDASSWTRGQAWAVYGFTMAYRYTKNEQYLEQAKATATFFLNQKDIAKNPIPFWDFDDPKIPNAPRDVSAGTIMASALIELYSYTREERFIQYARQVLNVLESKEYILAENIAAPFILKHSTGNLPANSEIDVPIVYADYYYLEAVLRNNSLKK